MADQIIQETYRFASIHPDRTVAFSRADLELYGINTFRPSFVGLVFLNDNEVDAGNATEDRPSYAGSFAVFGHQRCVGDEGHCDVPTSARRFDDRPSHPLTRAFRRVVITEALRQVLDTTDTVTITVVASATADDGTALHGPLLDLEGLQITTFA